MINTVIKVLEKILKQLNEKKSWFSALVLSLGFAFISLTILTGWEKISPYFQQVNIGYLLLAEGFIAIALILGVANWYFIQLAYELGLSWYASARAHFGSTVTRYIPGFVWQYLSKGYLSSGNSNNRLPITVALITEFIVLILGGFFILGLLPLLFQAIPASFFAPPFIWGCLVIVSILGIFLWFYISMRWLIKKKHDYLSQVSQIMWALLSSFGGWVSLSFATWFVIHAFLPDLSIQDYPQVQFALVASTITGILVVFVPGGIGVREAALAFFLQGILPPSMCIIISVFIRLGIIMGEILGFALISKGLPSILSVKNRK